MSDIRLISENSLDIIDLGTQIIKFWDHYNDESRQIVAFKDNERHHTVTPIMHRDGEKFVLDLVLRDNNTSERYPLGIFHPHAELWHIKKENIGLIEVMGRAILPGRLKSEMAEVKKYLLGQNNQIAENHLNWAQKIKANNNISEENVDKVLHQALVEVFEEVLQCAGVFKNTEDGNKGWEQFTTDLVKEVDQNEN